MGIREAIARFLLVWIAVLGFIIFLSLYLSGGEVILYEANPIIRLVELIAYSGILGFSIYHLAKLIRGKNGRPKMDR